MANYYIIGLKNDSLWEVVLYLGKTTRLAANKRLMTLQINQRYDALAVSSETTYQTLDH